MADPDENVFRYLSHEPAPNELGIPPDTKLPLDLRTTVEIMEERREWLANSKTCPCCGGKGRVAIEQGASTRDK